MDDQAVEIGEPVVAGDVVIRPIAQRRILTTSGEQAGAILARLRPLGVIVERAGELRTLDLDGEELAEDVLEALPEEP